jgi:hypothetical protein
VTFAEIIAQAKIDLRQDGIGGFTDAQLLSLAQEAEYDFCRFTSSREKITTRTVAAYDSVVSLPDDFLEGRQTRWSYNMLLYPKTMRQLYYDTREWDHKTGGIPTNIVYWNWNTIRLYPIPNTAGTVLFRHSYVNERNISLTDTPDSPVSWHSALVDFVVSECLSCQRKCDQADEVWNRYLSKRVKAKAQFNEGQRTPDTLQGMRPKTNFNWQLWNQRTM